MGTPLGGFIGVELVSLAACVPLAFVIVYGFKRRLSDSAAMGLVMALFLPAFGHLYVQRGAWMYVLGMLGAEALLGYLGNYAVARVLATVLSVVLMYRRLAAEPGSLKPADVPGSYALRVVLSAEDLAWVNDQADELDVQPAEVVRLALEHWREARSAERGREGA